VLVAAADQAVPAKELTRYPNAGEFFAGLDAQAPVVPASQEAPEMPAAPSSDEIELEDDEPEGDAPKARVKPSKKKRK